MIQHLRAFFINLNLKIFRDFEFRRRNERIYQFIYFKLTDIKIFL